MPAPAACDRNRQRPSCATAARPPRRGADPQERLRRPDREPDRASNAVRLRGRRRARASRLRRTARRRRRRPHRARAMGYEFPRGRLHFSAAGLLDHDGHRRHQFAERYRQIEEFVPRQLRMGATQAVPKHFRQRRSRSPLMSSARCRRASARDRQWQGFAAATAAPRRSRGRRAARCARRRRSMDSSRSGSRTDLRCGHPVRRHSLRLMVPILFDASAIAWKSNSATVNF